MKKSISIFLLIVFNLTFVICNLSLAGEYLLAPGDTLDVRVISKKDLDTKQAIAPDGTISLPFLGRVEAQGQTLKEFNSNLKSAFSKYIANAQVVVSLTPRPIYIIQHDVKKNIWDVKEAKSIDEAKALAGKNYDKPIQYGDIVSVDVSQKPDFFEANWYKIITAGAVLVGIYATLNR